MIKIGDFDFHNILLDEKSYGNILIYNISYKTLISAKRLRIRLDKVDGFIRVYNGSRYFLLFGPEKYDAIYNRIRYLVSQKRNITFFFFHDSTRMKIDLSDSLPLEKPLTLHNIITLIKSENQNHYYYNIFFKKCSYQSSRKNDNE